ncbi:MAG: UDP-glucose 6-dehydrogenase, partial [Planctomycetes bacterium]|nr:UDP-glucose 6-dehydrogenase [Planctomycetota bacterium]
MKLAIIGSGYVGLVAGACFADTGNDVAVVDIDVDKIRMLQQGQLPIYEPGLAELVARGVGAGRLTFTSEMAGAVRRSEIVFLAVGTPSAPDGTVEMRAMETAARQVAAAIADYTVIVVKSTV